MKIRFVIFCLLTICLGATAFAQQEEESTRGLWPPSFRPAATAAKPKPRTGTYKRVTPRPAPNPGEPLIEPSADTTVGVTLWRIRPEEPADAKNQELGRILVAVGGKKQTWIPERVEANTSFTFGQMVRLSIEVPRDGYLYVIDREQYADGSLGQPFLVFPQAVNENKVAAGRVIEIPNQQAEVFAFRFDPPKDGAHTLAAEMLTLLIAPAPLAELNKFIGAGEALDAAQVEKWEKLYGGKVEQLELKDGAGQAYTKVEKQAGQTRSTALTNEDPLPQTIFRVAAKPGKPLALRLPLRIGK
jgi:hypothetical protein